MTYINQLETLCQQCGCKMETEVPLAEHTTFRVGGPCRALVHVNSAREGAVMAIRIHHNGYFQFLAQPEDLIGILPGAGLVENGAFVQFHQLIVFLEAFEGGDIIKGEEIRGTVTDHVHAGGEAM